MGFRELEDMELSDYIVGVVTFGLSEYNNYSTINEFLSFTG
jgi:hypothetical protein